MGDSLKEFSIHGPYKIPLEPDMHDKMEAKNLSEFWSFVGEVRGRHGVYLFGIRAGKGITPIYVGKAAKLSFEEEAFQAHKRADHYNPALLNCKRGNPVMFFVVHPGTRGVINKTLIEKIESFLIDTASTKNPHLSNVRKKPNHKWRIRGVVRGKAGEATKTTGSFKKTVGLV